MKILYISNVPLPSEKSRSLSIMRVCQAFTDAGHDVTLVGRMPETKNEPDDPVKFYGLKGGFKTLRYRLSGFWCTRISVALLLDGLYLGWKTRKLIKRIKPDIVYSRLTISELLFVPSSLPIVFEMHSLGPLGQGGFRRLSFNLLTKIKNFKRIIVTTDVLSDLLSKKLPKNIEIKVARLSADLPIELQSDKLRQFRSEEVKGSGFSFHVGYTGYLDTRGLRGTDIIIKTAATLPDVAFHIVGGESEVVEYWKKFAEEYNQNSNIFFYGYRNPNEMPYFLNCFDVTLAPLQYRPSERAPIGQNMSPLKLPQYMGYGKAIVASDIPSHRECLSDKKNALLVQHDDINAWSQAIKLLQSDPDFRKRISQAAREAYYAGFTHEIRTQKIFSGVLP